jgi:hypothetical protein
MYGPTLVPRTTGSVNMLARFMLGEYKMVPNLAMPSVDVRESALAHLKAF